MELQEEKRTILEKPGDRVSSQPAREYSMTEVRKHDSADSCWLAINNKVYDVTKFLAKHPGGEECILEETGGYATRAFRDVRHSQYANNILKRYQIGVLVKEDREQLGQSSEKTGSSGSSGCVDLCCQACTLQ